MSDMIERLRNAQRLMFDHNSTQPGLYGQAADEIELLRGQLLSSYARIDELEGAIKTAKGFIGPADGTMDAWIILSKALEGGNDSE